MPAAGNPHLSIHPDAEEELVAAAQYYDRRRSGLGDEFLRQMQRLIEFALENPELGTPKRVLGAPEPGNHPPPPPFRFSA